MSAALQSQFRIGRWTLLLDGRVVETFYEGSSLSTRYHVDHLAIEARPDRDGLRIRWGIDVSGRIIDGGKATIPSAEIPAFQTFIAAARANRSTA